MKGKKTGGRQKGSQNKVTIAVKEMVIAALDKAGGIDYLVAQSSSNPNAFLSLVGRVIPTQLTGDPNAPIMTRIELVDGNRSD